MKDGGEEKDTPVFLSGESQGLRSLVGCRLWGHTESDTTEVTMNCSTPGLPVHHQCPEFTQTHVGFLTRYDGEFR